MSPKEMLMVMTTDDEVLYIKDAHGGSAIPRFINICHMKHRKKFTF
jgi:hypothetical protein